MRTDRGEDGDEMSEFDGGLRESEDLLGNDKRNPTSMDELHQIRCPLPPSLASHLPLLSSAHHVFLQSPNCQPPWQQPLPQAPSGGHVSHSTITRSDSREHLASTVDDGALYPTPTKVHPLLLLDCPGAKENDRYYNKEQSPASSFRLATWRPSTSGGATSLKNVTIVTPSGGRLSGPLSILKCPEEPVSPCSSAHRILLTLT